MKLTSLALAASLAIGSATFARIVSAQVQTTSTVAVPAMEEVETVGTVARYIVSPSGAVRGIMLGDNTLVFVHGTRAQTLPQRAPAGTSLRIAGFANARQPRAIHRPTVRASDGTVLLQSSAVRPQRDARANGGDLAARRAQVRAARVARLSRLPALTAQGTVASIVRDRRGQIDGLLLADGTSVVLSRRLGREVHGHGVRRGETLRIAGHGGSYANGRSVFAEQITFADGAVVSVPLAALHARG